MADEVRKQPLMDERKKMDAEEDSKSDDNRAQALSNRATKVTSTMSSVINTLSAMPSSSEEVTGFERGLIAEKIVGATDQFGEIKFLVKWKGSDDADLVSNHQAKMHIPQLVIAFYEERLFWKEDF